MKKMFILIGVSLSVLLCLGGCSPESESRQSESSTLLQETSSNNNAVYQGDGMDLLPVVRRSDSQCVLIASNGDIIMPCDRGRPVGAGLIFVDGDGAYTFDGKLAFANKFHYVGNFVDGLAPAGIMSADKTARYGFINTSGQFVVEPQYLGASEFSEERAAVLINEQDGERNYGFITATGEILYSGFADAHRFSDGLAQVKDPESGLYGYIGLNGEYAIPPQYGFASDFSEGLAAVALPCEEFADRTYGYIDKNGITVLSPNYGFAAAFHGGVTAVSFGNAYDISELYLIDSAGEKVSPQIFEEVIPISQFGSSIYWLREVSQGDKYFMDVTTGKVVLSDFLFIE